MNAVNHSHFVSDPTNNPPMANAADRLREIRRSPANLNHWYVAVQSRELTTNPIGIVLWQLPIVLYRNAEGQAQALEDRCPHRQVKLSEGQVRDNALECAYHGWQFDASGQCSHVPYLGDRQKLPACKLRVYPVREQDGFVWVFPGDLDWLDRTSVEPLALPEWDDLNHITSVAMFHCPAHFSYLIENLMDMYHGHLHDNYQAWADPSLQDLAATGDRVDAFYQAQSYYKIDKIWSVLQLVIPAMRQLHPEPLNVSYVYPHWTSTLGKEFRIVCLFCPIDETQTRAYLIHFTSLQAFHRLHKLPIRFRQFVKDRCFNAARKLLENLIEQDLRMMAQEQQAFLAQPDRPNYELNPAVTKVQQLIRQQASRSPL